MLSVCVHYRSYILTETKKKGLNSLLQQKTIKNYTTAHCRG